MTTTIIEPLLLERVELRRSPDSVKTDLEVTCVTCQTVLCDAEAGDTLAVLARVAAAHDCETACLCPDHDPWAPREHYHPDCPLTPSEDRP